MTKIPVLNDVPPETLQYAILLPMQYQRMMDGKFVSQCFKCRKQYRVSKNLCDFMDES